MAEHASAEQVKAALLISGVDQRRFRKLKDELANNYLLSTDQHPDTLEKAGRILANYQTTKIGTPYRGSPNDMGVAFLQQGGQGGRGGRGGRAGRGAKSKGGGSNEGTSAGNNVSKITGRTGSKTAKTNSRVNPTALIAGPQVTGHTSALSLAANNNRSFT